MIIKLNEKESEEYFYNALCNGLNYISSYGLDIEYDGAEYRNSKSKLVEPCFEDVLMQMLKDGFKITLIDEECDGEYTKSITIEDVHEKVQNTPLRHLQNMIEQRDDAETADVILQTVFFNDIIFG